MSMITKTDFDPAWLEAGLKMVFDQEYQRQINDDWTKLVTNVESTKGYEKYGFMGANPVMREFKDQRQPAGIQTTEFVITNKKYESTLAVDRDLIDDDQYGQIAMAIKLLAENVRSWKDECAFTSFFAGDTATYGSCYDTLDFFSASHVEGKYYTTVQANLGALALTSKNLNATRAAMRKFKDDQGRPVNIVPDTLIVGPDLEDLAYQLTMSTTTDASGNATGAMTGLVNPNRNRFNVIVTPYIDAANNWILADTHSVMKPMIYQNRLDAEFAAQEANSVSGFMSDKYMYGVKTRFAFGYGDWRKAYKQIP